MPAGRATGNLPAVTALRRKDVAKTADEPRLRYVPAIDGLRALAVSAVFAYHAGIGWARGGFLGVDVFFVISGYLITGLLLADYRRTSRLRLLRFWRRRARRLLPALLLVLVGVSVAVPLLASDQGYRLRADVLAALGYVSNWRLIFEHQSYFQSLGRPPLLQHLWSLAVEEQFYLLWPLVLALLLKWREPRRLVGPILGLAAASAVLMAVLHDPTGDPSRVYYGTDTRVAGILVGAALACVPFRWKAKPGPMSRTGRLALEAAGGAVLWGLWLCLSRVDQFDPLLYRGGFVGAAVLAGVAIVVATHPRSWVAAGLGSRPLVWLGRRSYAVYLWFWPVFMLTRPHSDVPLTGTPLLVLRTAITLALATASYRWVEKPVREGALGRVWADLRIGLAGRSRPSTTAVRWTLGSALVVVVVASALVIGHPVPAPPFSVPAAAASAVGRASPVEAAAAASAVPDPAAPAVGTAPGEASPPLVVTQAAVAVAVPEPAPAPEPAPEPADAAAAPAPAPSGPPPGTRVTAIGESVMIVAQPAMEAEGIYVDAVIGRQFDESLAVARTLRDSGGLGEIVVVHLGNNGPVTEGQFDELMDVLSVARRVVVVNVRVPRPWEEHNNNLFAAAVPRFPNAVVVDWRAVGDSHPEAFVDDGVHMTHGGVQLYLDLLHSGM